MRHGEAGSERALELAGLAHRFVYSLEAHVSPSYLSMKESAIQKFVIRLLRDGKQLTPAQLEAAEAAGVAVDRLRQVFGRTTDLG